MSVCLLGACRVDGRVDLGVRADGSGLVAVTVTLDRDAVAEIGDLTSRLRIADLEAAGWDLEGPVEIDDGAWRVRATKAFVSVARAEAVLAEVGPPVAGLQLRRARQVFRTTTEVHGTLDLTAGLAAFSDAELAGHLGGLPFGVDEAELERRFGVPPADAVGLEVVVQLPGEDPPATLTPRVGDRVDVALTSSRLNRVNIVFAIVSLLLAAAFVATFPRPRWRRPSP